MPHTISEKRLAANRANAKKSTGPRTPEGKARSSMNALVHGLAARRVVLPNEDREAFDAFARAMRKDLRPLGPVQHLLVDQVINAAWKLRRARAAHDRVVRHALLRYAGPARRVTAGVLLADALADDPRAEPFAKLEKFTERAQRAFFTALRRLNEARRAEARSEAGREPGREAQRAAKHEVKRKAPARSEPTGGAAGPAPAPGATPVAGAGCDRGPGRAGGSPHRLVRATNPIRPVFPGDSGTVPPADSPAGMN